MYFPIRMLGVDLGNKICVKAHCFLDLKGQQSPLIFDIVIYIYYLIITNQYALLIQKASNGSETFRQLGQLWYIFCKGVLRKGANIRD